MTVYYEEYNVAYRSVLVPEYTTAQDLSRALNGRAVLHKVRNVYFVYVHVLQQCNWVKYVAELDYLT